MAFTVDCKVEKSYIDRTRTVEIYFSEIRKYPVLSQREERELLKIVKTGDAVEAKKARDRIVNCNQRFVVSVAKKWYNGENIMDVIDEGNIGLMEAIDKYDLNRQERFITYAVWWVRKRINDYIINKQGIVKPSNANKIYTYVNKARSRFYTLNERYPTFMELKAILRKKYGITVTDMNDLAQFDFFSLDCDSSEIEDNGYATSIANEALMTNSTNDLDNSHDIEHTQKYVADLLKMKLSDKEEWVIRGYYGIGRDQETLDTMALQLGVCRERVRQLYNDALKKLRKTA